MKQFAVMFLIILAVLGSACMWDYDTLAMEAKGLPNAVRVCTGRFERNPPLYFQMRLDRVSKEIVTNPTKLELYDDAGVACARLNRNDEAIQWMAQKRKVLVQLKKQGKDPKDHWYRYHANLGTFLIHKWLHDGADGKHLEGAKASRDHIAKAIEINPEAHFGREYMQLAAIDAIISLKIKKSDTFSLDPFVKDRKPEQKVEGICGLIVLGAAWESVDIYNELARALSESRNPSVGYLATLRRNELLDQGKKPLGMKADEMRKTSPEDEMMMVVESTKPEIAKDFKRLRDEAEAYHKARTDYMMARLKQGKHPDTDPQFWAEWKEPPIPVIRDWKSMTYYPWGTIAIGVVGLAVFITLLVLGLTRIARRTAR